MNPLMTIKGTLAVGFILALAVAFGMGSGVDGLKAAAMTWLHVMAGVVWIGLLYYFNFVQVPGVGKALAEANDGGPGPAAINKYVAPTALLWFRMAAAVTFLTGDDDIRKAKEIMQGIIDADERILKEPAPLIAVGELADSSVNFNVRPWVKSGDYWAVLFDLNEKIKIAFDDNGISIPYPQMDVHMSKPE